MIKKLYLTALILTVGLLKYANSQTIVNSGPDYVCGTSATGTLTVQNYTKVRQWEEGELIGGTFYPAIIYSNTSPTFSYNTSYTTYYRAKLTSTSYTAVKTITVVSPPIGGSLSGGGAFLSNASGTLTLSGQSGQIVKWQSNTNGSWIDIPNTSSSYTFNNVTTTIQYRVLISKSGCSSVYSSTVTVTIYHPSTLSGSTTVGEGGTATLSLSNNDGSVVQWEYSDDGGTSWNVIPDWNGSSSNPRQIDYSNAAIGTRLYRALLVYGSVGNFYSNTQQVSVIPYTQANPVSNVAGQTYIKDHTITVSGVITPSQVDALDASGQHESITYLDGLGREVQSISRRASPAQNDIIGFAVYDNLGRASTQYLPYATTQTSGAYRSNPVTDQSSFYANGTADKIADSSYPFAKTVFESSPLGRVVEQGMPGQEWQPGSAHTLRQGFDSNSANDAVRLFKSDGTSTTFYAANELYKTEMTDENGNKTRIFTDKFGRTILKKVQLDETINGSNVAWLDTYFIYDVLGHLRYMISPKGANVLAGNGWNFTAIKDNYVYQFVFDQKGRLIEKKTPGQDWMYYGYDRLDRLVLLQDANIRPQNKWFYVKYDRQGRPVIQGLYTNPTYTTRAAIQQNILDPLYADPADKYYEEKGSMAHGYTNQSFPSANTVPLMVNYYDNYDFDNNGTADFNYTSQGLTGEGTATAYTEGFPTGSKRLIMGTSSWLYNYVFYDKYGRVIQTRSNNHLWSTIDNLTTLVYDFEGKVLIKKTYHKTSAVNVITVVNKYEYTNGLLTRIYQNNNNAPSDQLIAQYEYNELGQLVDKKLHNTSGTSFLQSVDFRYSIRGWLQSINNAQLNANSANNDETTDYFGMEFLYNTTESGLNDQTGDKVYYDGNISAVKWKAPGVASGVTDQKSYKFLFDKAGRMKSARSQMYNSGWSKEVGALNETLTYDHNGNILTLQRNQRKHNLTGTVANYITEQMDNLTYTYHSSIGDRLLKVTDAATATGGFDNGASGTSDDFAYDANGNVTADLNKGISSVVYNELGKAAQVNFSDGRKLEYTFDAAGSKLTMKMYEGATLKTTTDYVDGFVYENANLSFFGSPEGRVVRNSAGALEYQYAIQDNQGNVRVIFSSVNPSETKTATFEGNSGDNSGEFSNVSNVVTFIGANHTLSGTKVIRMNQNYNLGATMSLAVFPGDKVDLEVWAYHENSSGYGTTSSTVTNIISTVAGAFGGVSGGPGVEGQIYNGVNSAVEAFGFGGNRGDTKPAAYLNYILFDKNYKVLDMGWKPAPDNAFTQQRLSFNTIDIKEPGFMFVYLSYDNASNNYVYFDDLKISHTNTNVIQYNEYYPFGLQTSNSWTREGSKNNFLYNAASELNITSGWYEMFFRGYDAALGRFLQVDPKAALAHSMSSYQYANNNPILFNDPLGDQTVMQQLVERSNKLDEMMGLGSSAGGGGGGGNTVSRPVGGTDWDSYYAAVDYENGGDGWSNSNQSNYNAGDMNSFVTYLNELVKAAPQGSTTYSGGQIHAGYTEYLSTGSVVNPIHYAHGGYNFRRRNGSNVSFKWLGYQAGPGGPNAIPNEGTWYTGFHSSNYDIVREHEIKHTNFGYTETTRVVTIAYGEGKKHKIEKYGYQIKSYYWYGTQEQWDNSPYISPTVLGYLDEYSKAFREQVYIAVNNHLGCDCYTDWITVPKNRLIIGPPHY